MGMNDGTCLDLDQTTPLQTFPGLAWGVKVPERSPEKVGAGQTGDAIRGQSLVRSTVAVAAHQAGPRTQESSPDAQSALVRAAQRRYPS